MSDTLKIERLNSINYENWKYRVELYLVKEDLWEVIAEPTPEEPDAAWVKKDGKARATIGLLVEDSQLLHIKGKQTAREYWEALRCYHRRGTLTSKVFLIKRLCRLQLEENGDLEKHVLELTGLCEKLAGMGEPLSEKWYVAFLLCSMPDSYENLITALESRSDNDLTLDYVKSKLLHEYFKRKELKQTPEPAQATSSEVALKTETGIRTCYFCNKPGHIKRFCYLYKNSLKKNSTANIIRSGNTCLKIGEVYDKNQRNWYVDSGATQHMCNYESFFTKLNFKKQNVFLADGSQLPCHGIGEGVVTIQLDGKTLKTVQIKDVWYVPGLDSCLLSVQVMTGRGLKVIFEDRKCNILDGNQIFAEAKLENSLYKLCLAENVCNKVGTDKCIHSWHRRLGHRNLKDLTLMKSMVNGMDMKDCSHKNDKLCDVCVLGKHHRDPFLTSQSTTKQVLDLVHSDICGPMEVQTPGKKKYFLTCIDDFSRYTTVYLLERKSDASERIQEFARWVENKFGRKIKVFRSDGGGEFVNKELKEFFLKNGIEHQVTVPYSPQQNGVAERKNRTLVEMIRCMLFDAGLQKKYWGEAMLTACYLQNRQPTSGNAKTPYEKWVGNPPSVRHIRTFGCCAYAHVDKQKRQKLDPKSEKLVMVGYSDVTKGYRLLNPTNDKITISRDVIFFEKEEETSLEEKNSKGKLTDIKESRIEEVTLDLGSDKDIGAKFHEKEPEINNEFDQEDLWNEVQGQNEGATLDNIQEIEEDAADEIMEIGQEDMVQNETNNVEPEARRSSRSTKGIPPKRYRADKVVREVTAEEPQNFKEAVKSPKCEEWKSAMLDELKSLNDNKTWELVELPRGVAPVGNKWVYKIKKDPQGNVIKYKARLVAQGFSQKYGTDYDEVFAPVVKPTTFRTYLTLAGMLDWHVKHYDVKTAFLNGDIEENIYMYQPTGFAKEGKEHLFCKLKKSLYGLRQSARAWNIKLNKVLTSLGFRKGKADPCFYSKKVSNSVIHVFVYVDDMIIGSSDLSLIRKTEEDLNQEFEVKGLGDIKCYLGVEVERVDGIFHIHQSNYINQTLKLFGQEDAKGSKYPMDTGYFKICKKDNEVLEPEKYRELIGRLLYLSVNTRPDISACVSILSRKVSCPTQTEWVEVRRVLRYLKMTSQYRLRLGNKKDPHSLIGFADADWAEDPTDRKSTSGYVFQFNGATISWASRKQSLVALSSTEAEFISLTEACQEMVWIEVLLEDMNVEIKRKLLFEDNQSCLSMLKSEKVATRTKHIAVKYHFTKETIQERKIDLEYCPSETMLADVMTKPLGGVRTQKLCSLLNLYSIEEGCCTD